MPRSKVVKLRLTRRGIASMARNARLDNDDDDIVLPDLPQPPSPRPPPLAFKKQMHERQSGANGTGGTEKNAGKRPAGLVKVKARAVQASGGRAAEATGPRIESGARRTRPRPYDEFFPPPSLGSSSSSLSPSSSEEAPKNGHEEGKEEERWEEPEQEQRPRRKYIERSAKRKCMWVSSKHKSAPQSPPPAHRSAAPAVSTTQSQRSQLARGPESELERQPANGAIDAKDTAQPDPKALLSKFCQELKSLAQTLSTANDRLPRDAVADLLQVIGNNWEVEEMDLTVRGIVTQYERSGRGWRDTKKTAGRLKDFLEYEKRIAREAENGSGEREI